MLRMLAGAGAILFAAIALAPQAGRAATPGLQISVQPLIVQFTLAPGGQASTQVTIKNTGTESARVAVTPIDWDTTVDGSVRTGKPGSIPASSSLSPYLRISGNEVVLAPGQTSELTLSLVLPTTFSAVPKDYWGGYFVRAVANKLQPESFGVGANVLVYETIGTPSRHVKLTSLRVQDAGSGSVKLIARMQNDGGTFVRPQIHLDVAQAGRLLQSRDDSTPAIFAGAARLYTRTFAGLPPGKYALDMTIDYGGNTLVQGSTEFTVR